MSDLRNRLRSETRTQHDSLEERAPFKHLMNSEDLELHLAQASLCFKLIFQPFLASLKEQHSFFKSAFEILESIHTEYNLELSPIDIDSANGSLGHRYLFLGSRMGNRLIIQKNPAILESRYGAYFDLDMPRDLWTDLMSRLDSITAPSEQDLIIFQAQQAFQTLINYSLLVSAKK